MKNIEMEGKTGTEIGRRTLTGEAGKTKFRTVEKERNGFH